jgi:hypothetical protein
MRASIAIACLLGGVLMTSITPVPAQQQQPYFKDGTINFDREKFKKEFEALERLADRPARAARSLRRNEFCIVCDDGTRINCKSLFGGEPGRLACGAKGILLCSNHTGRVDFGRC